MIKTDRFNRISKELENQYRLRPGESKVFRYSRIRRETHPEAQNQFIIPAAFHIPTQVVIWDPYLEASVEIAAIRRIGLGGEVEFQRVAFEKKSAGIIVLSGDNPEHRDLYVFLCLHPWNRDAPDRPENSPDYFFMEQPEVEAADNRSRRSMLIEALSSASSLTNARLKTMVAALGYSDRQPIEVLRDIVESYAEQRPAEYLAMAGSKDTNIRASITRAFGSNIIQFNAREKRIVWSDTQSAICTVPPGKDYKETLFNFVLSNELGDRTIDAIKSHLGAWDAENPEVDEVVDEQKETQKKKVTRKAGKTVGVAKIS